MDWTLGGPKSPKSVAQIEEGGAGDDEEIAIPRVYEDLENFDVIKAIFEKLLVEYNEHPANKGSKMRLVFFEDALEHFAYDLVGEV